MELVGASVDVDGERLLLFADWKSNLYMEYKGERVEVEESYLKVKDGTYNQPVRDVPYFVLDKNVYPLTNFREIGRGK